MRGFGQSSPAAGPLCRRDDLDRLLAHLDVTQVHLVGCSNGGQFSLNITLEQPQHFASLTLVNSTPSGFDLQGRPPPRHMLEMFDAMQRGDINHSNELQIRIWLDGEYREIWTGQFLNCAKRLWKSNHIPVSQSTFFIADTRRINPLDPSAILPLLKSVNCPTLVVAGSLDLS